MQMNPYLSFNGDCEAAFKFYERCLDAKLGEMFRYGGSPMADHAPADWADKIMHASLTIGDQLVMGADVVPDKYEEPKGISLSLQIKSVDEAERVFRELSQDGSVMMPLQKTFWAERSGVVLDRFRIPWLVNCEGTDQRTTRKNSEGN